MNRGGHLRSVSVSATDPLWLPGDYGRAMTLVARWLGMGVKAEECDQLLPCAVWLAKFPGTRYSDAIMERLSELRCVS
jgi:hypothetical protein